jgi:hypothetical protein
MSITGIFNPEKSITCAFRKAELNSIPGVKVSISAASDERPTTKPVLIEIPLVRSLGFQVPFFLGHQEVVDRFFCGFDQDINITCISIYAIVDCGMSANQNEFDLKFEEIS